MKIIRITTLLLAVLTLISGFASCNNENAEDRPIESAGYKGDMSRYISVPDLKSITVNDSDVRAEWEAISLAIRLEYTDYTLLDGENAEARLYDRLNVDYTVSEDNEKSVYDKLSGIMKVESFDLIIGAGRLIPAYKHPDDSSLDTKSFEEQLVGAKTGETVSVTVTFPEGYTFTYGDPDGSISAACAGKRCVFDVKINGISRGEVPELAANLISNYTAEMYTTVSAYREYIYNYYRSSFAYDSIMRSTVVKEYPEDELYSARLNYMTSVIESRYSGAELDDEDVKALYDMLYAEADEYAKQAVLERMLLEYLFDECEITLTESGYRSMLESDYRSRYYEYYMNYGVASMEEYEAHFGKENLVLQYKYQKMMDALVSMVTVIPED